MTRTLDKKKKHNKVSEGVGNKRFDGSYYV
jgi:hypothetical protein